MSAQSFLDGRVTLFAGDSREVLRGFADASIDSVVTDPPYALVPIGKRFGKPGALNIDGCRVGTEGGTASGRVAGASAGVLGHGLNGGGAFAIDAGRWPANIVHDGSDEVVAAFPDTGASSDRPRHNGEFKSVAKGRDLPHVTLGHADAGGSAARFYYSAKADAQDRIGSKHPTVKPVDLMQWLCRLVTPPGGTVLDPFAGSGSTGEAAWREGFRSVLIEREEAYRADIARRLAHCLAGPATRKATIAATKASAPLGGLFAEAPAVIPGRSAAQTRDSQAGCGAGDHADRDARVRPEHDAPLDLAEAS